MGRLRAAYRILQESLTNVLRHAGPEASADVRLRYTPGALTIQVTDNGAAAGAGPGCAEPGGGEPGRGAGCGHGLTGMTERAAAVGGELSAGHRADGGFEVVARLPVPGPGPGQEVGAPP